MAKFYTDFSDQAVWSYPSGWGSVFFGGRGTDWVVNADGTATGGKVLSAREPAGVQVISWDAIGSVGDVDVVIRGKLNQESGGGYSYMTVCGAAVRFVDNGDPEFLSGYSGEVWIDSAGNGVCRIGRLFEYQTDVEPLAQVPFAIGSATGLWMRFRATGPLLQLRAWLDGDTEPNTWNVETTDSTYTSGAVGVLDSSGYFSSITDVFGVGTNGDSAPRGVEIPITAVFDTNRVVRSSATVKPDTRRAVRTVTTGKPDSKRAVRTKAVVSSDSKRRVVVKVGVSSDSRRVVRAASVIKADTTRQARVLASVKADTSRRTAVPASVKADTSRRTSLPASVKADTSRRTSIPASVKADTYRPLRTLASVKADTSRRTVLPVTIKSDTRRAVRTVALVKVDTVRRALVPTSIQSDTRRIVRAATSGKVDTTRTIRSAVTFEADTRRTSRRQETAKADSRRSVTVAELVRANALRVVGLALSIVADVLRRVISNVSVEADTLRRAQVATATSADTRRNVSTAVVSAVDTFRRVGGLEIIRPWTLRLVKAYMRGRPDTRRTVASPARCRLLSQSSVSTGPIIPGVEVRHLDSPTLRYRVGETRAPRIQVYTDRGQPPMPSGATWELVTRSGSVRGSGVCTIVEGYVVVATVTLGERGLFTLRLTIHVGSEVLKPEYLVEVS